MYIYVSQIIILVITNCRLDYKPQIAKILKEFKIFEVHRWKKEDIKEIQMI